MLHRFRSRKLLISFTSNLSSYFQSENGGISKKDFRYILRELGDITDNQIIDEIFNEADVDGNGVIDYDEFTYMVKNYMTDDDIV